MLKQKARTLLLAATGGIFYYEQLWGHVLMQSNYCLNRVDWKSRKSPFFQLTGEDYSWKIQDHVFGELCTWGVPKERRLGEYQPPGEVGIWVRRDDTSVGSAVVVPISWQRSTKSWVLHPTVVANTVKVHSGVYPLAMCPGEDPTDFTEFVDATFDTLLSAAAFRESAEEETTRDLEVAEVESGAQLAPTTDDGYDTPDDLPEEMVDSDGSESDCDDEFEVEQILNRRTIKGKVQYLIRWKGYSRKHDSWEPSSSVSSPKLVQEYNKKLRSAHGCVTLADALHRDGYESVLEYDTCHQFSAYLASKSMGNLSSSNREGLQPSDPGEAMKAVVELQRKQKVSGNPAEWVQGYQDEFNSVSKLRLRELSPEEASRVRAEELVPRLRMILEAKRDGRKKGRLILQGFLEPRSWDGGVATDSPVAYMGTIRALLAKSGKSDVISQRDVSVAFLQSTEYAADEPKRYVSYAAYKGAQERMYELLGPLYGQRSASRRWYETFAGWLTSKEMGFIQGNNEPCLFRHPETGLVVVLYVDDVLSRGSEHDTDAFHLALGKRFKCKPEERLAVDHQLDFLGFTLTKSFVNDSPAIYIDQQESMISFLSKFERKQLKPRACPMPTNSLLHSDASPLSENATALYKHAVGTLNYFSKCIRFDIAHAVSRLSSKMSCPDAGSWKSLMHLLGYLNVTTDFRIGGVIGDTDDFAFYADSDHAGDKLSSSRSQTGYILFLNEFPVEWCSRKQPLTSTSPAEAEIYAMKEAVQSARLLQWVAEEMGMVVDWPFTIYTDSSQAHSFQHNTCPNSKIRGCFDLRDKCVKELRDKGVVKSVKIPRDLNVADLLTHCLPKSKFSEVLERARNLRYYNCTAACVFKHVYTVQLYSST